MSGHLSSEGKTARQRFLEMAHSLGGVLCVGSDKSREVGETIWMGDAEDGLIPCRVIRKATAEECRKQTLKLYGKAVTVRQQREHFPQMKFFYAVEVPEIKAQNN